jgi:hypothetical protein
MRSLADAPYVYTACLVVRVPCDLVNADRKLFVDKNRDLDAEQIVHVNRHVTRLSDRIFKDTL